MAKGKRSLGNFKKEVTGESKVHKKSESPDALKTPTQMKSAKRAGQIFKNEDAPSLSPIVKDEYTSAFFDTAKERIRRIIMGIIMSEDSFIFRFSFP